MSDYLGKSYKNVKPLIEQADYKFELTIQPPKGVDVSFDELRWILEKMLEYLPVGTLLECTRTPRVVPRETLKVTK